MQTDQHNRCPWPDPIPTPDEPLRTALIGTGFRSWNTYRELFPHVEPWMRIVACCDPVDDNRERMADALGVPGYADVHDLVKDKPMEAALIVTPVPSHYSLTMLLIDNGIHCHTETSWMSLLRQALDVVEAAKQRGAAEVIDKSTADLWAEAERLSPEGYDVVLDANGVATLKQSYEHLRPTGRLVVYGFATMLRKGRGKPNWPGLALAWLRTPRFDPLEMTNSNRSVLAFNLSYLFAEKTLLGEAMGKLLGWLEEDRIEAPPVTAYPFEEVAKAHRDIEGGATVGKLVLRVAS